MQPSGTTAKADYTANQSRPSPEFLCELDRIIHVALREDLFAAGSTGTSYIDADVTTVATVPADRQATAELIVKTPGIVAGLDIAERVFKLVDQTATFTVVHGEGTYIDTTAAVVAKINATARGLLVAERTALNLMQRLSGIATVTRQFADKARPFGIAVLDTRKTTPGLRLLEKYAVTIGGGTNHRFGLFDAILIKDNHISIAGGVKQAVQQARANCPGMPVEVEVGTLEELDQALEQEAEKVMLDNMTPEQIRAAVEKISGRAFVEVSGGINADNFDRYLIKGVDAISIGALTHSVRSLDISLEIEG